MWACFSSSDSIRPVFFFFFSSFYPLTDWIDILPGTRYVPQGTHLFPFWKIETPSYISCLSYDPTEYPNVQAREVRIILDPSSFSAISVVSFLLVCLCSHLSNPPPSCLCLLLPHLWSDASSQSTYSPTIVSLLWSCCLRYVSTRKSENLYKMQTQSCQDQLKAFHNL